MHDAAGPHPAVCQLVSTFRPSIGGVQTATEDLAASLRDLGTDVVVVTRRLSGSARREVVRGVPVYRVGSPGTGKLASVSFALGALSLLATRLRKFKVVHVQNIDTPLLAGMIARVILGRRLVVTIHGERKIKMKTTTVAGRLRLKLMVWLASAYGALTPAIKEELEGVGVREERVTLIPNGIDLVTFRPPTERERSRLRAELGLNQASFVAAFVGRLVALKGLDTLVQAWSKLESEDVLLIAGAGPERNGVVEAVDRRGSGNIRMLGALRDVRPVLGAADLFVLPSREEGLSRALLEAMAVGVCPVVTDLPGNRSLIEDAVNGRLVPADRPALLAERIMELRDEPSRRQRLGQAARATAVRKASLAAVGRAHVDMYASVA